MLCLGAGTRRLWAVTLSDGWAVDAESIAAMRRDASDDPKNARGEDRASAETIDSFERILQVYHKKIFNLSYRLLGNTDDAADLTQETFIKAYKSYPRFRGSSSAIYPWLCKIAVNGCKNRFKEIGRRNQYEAFSLDEQIGSDEAGLHFDIGDDSGNPAGVLERKEIETKVQETIQTLPPEFRVVVILRDIVGLSYQEIADTTDLSLELVKVRLFRGRGIIRRCLLPYVDE